MVDQVFKKLIRLFPSEVASLALGRKTAAIYRGDVMWEISTVEIEYWDEN